MVYLAALSLILLTHNAVEAIIGGKPATKHEIAHLISLRDIVADKQFGQGHYCGGALYLEKFILTSAICISDFKKGKLMAPGLVRVVGGQLNKDTLGQSYNSILTTIRTHPKYNIKRRDYNLAFITPAEPVLSENFRFRGITLSPSVPQRNTACQIISWGRIEPNGSAYAYPQIANVKLLGMEFCEQYYTKIPYDTLCFGAMGVAVCPEDAGSVVFCQAQAMGIIMYLGNCRKNNQITPFVATSIPNFHRWITDNGAAEICVTLALKLLCFIFWYWM